MLCDIADKLTPVRAIRRCPGRPTPWFDDECRAERRCCRRLERRYRCTRCAEDHRRWVDAARRRLRLNRAKYEEYWLGCLNQCGRSSSMLWRSLSPLLGRDCDVAGSTDHTADSFGEFFDMKVRDVRSAMLGCHHHRHREWRRHRWRRSDRALRPRCVASLCSRQLSRSRWTQCRRTW